MYLRRDVFKGRGRAYERGVQPVHWSVARRARESLGCIFNSNPQFWGPQAVLFRLGNFYWRPCVEDGKFMDFFLVGFHW